MAFHLAGEITQVKESIPLVRCASGNVSKHVMIKVKRSDGLWPFNGQWPARSPGPTYNHFVRCGVCQSVLEYNTFDQKKSSVAVQNILQNISTFFPLPFLQHHEEDLSCLPFNICIFRYVFLSSKKCGKYFLLKLSPSWWLCFFIRWSWRTGWMLRQIERLTGHVRGKVGQWWRGWGGRGGISWRGAW